MLVVSVVEPSIKVTVPVADEGRTVAVTITVWPAPDGLAEELSIVVVLPGFTVCVKAAEVLAEVFGSPG